MKRLTPTSLLAQSAWQRLVLTLPALVLLWLAVAWAWSGSA
jgi:hypothetical protein